MAYQLHYWAKEHYWTEENEAYYELKVVRLNKISEAEQLALEANRPTETDLVTVDRTDHQSPIEKVIWKRN